MVSASHLRCAVLCLCLSISMVSGQEGPRILGGEDADPQEFPFIALVQTPSFTAGFTSQCGGSLIAADVVLTAAHCISGCDNNGVFRLKDLGTVRMGLHDLTTTADPPGVEEIAVAQHVIHPDYAGACVFDGENWEFPVVSNDIALLFLSTASAFQPIPIDGAPDFEVVGTPLWVAGWGALGMDDRFPDILQKVQVRVDEIDGNRIEAGDIGQDACRGDSGGPLFDDGPNGFTLVGAVESGPSCEEDQDGDRVGIYTRISFHTQWICETAGVCPTTCSLPAVPTGSVLVDCAGPQLINRQRCQVQSADPSLSCSGSGVCHESGVFIWDLEFPECFAAGCRVPAAPADGIISGGGPNSGGASCTVNGFIDLTQTCSVQPIDAGTTRCTGIGECTIAGNFVWNLEFPSCGSAQCPALSITGGGTSTCAGPQAIGTSCPITPDAGHVCDHAVTICLDSGEWDAQATCTPLTCTVPSVEGGQWQSPCVPGGTVNSGDTCTLAPMTGYECEHDGQRQCQDDGNFEEKWDMIPSCAKVRCEVPSVAGVQWSGEGCVPGGRVEFGSACTSSARSLYSCSGLGSHVCQADGSFLPEQPSCSYNWWLILLGWHHN